MPQFGEISQKRLAECAKPLQDIANEVIKTFDFTILCGHRGELEQTKMLKEGKSTLSYPNSKHNQMPSIAIDVAPYPIDWNDKERFFLLAGLFFATANAKGIVLRWGGDWNCNWNFEDQTFDDLPHFELVL